MKRKDIILIVVIIVISGIVSLLITKLLFGSPQDRQQQVEVVQPITADFPKPDSKYFNNTAFDPTRQITIGQNANPDPFRGTPGQ